MNKRVPYTIIPKYLKTINDLEIFEDTSKTIYKALQQTFSKNKKQNNISKTAFEIALNQLLVK